MNVCPYCRDGLSPEASSYMSCGECGTPHHRECYDENGGCTLFGCKNAPPDEPKLQVTNTDVAFAQPGTVALAAAAQPATGFGDVNAVLTFGAGSGPARVPPPPPRVAPPPLPGSPAAATAPARAGYVTPGGIFSVPAQAAHAAPGAERKSRIAFILLGLFFGALGVHNFYAGFHKRGAMQLAISILTFFYGAIVSWVWAVAEICTVHRDADGIHFA